MKLKHMRFILLSLLAVLMSGCISDDYDDCEPAFIHFSYTGDGTAQIFDQKIEKVDFFVFNSDKRNILIQSVSKSELMQNHGVRLDVPPGDYYILCVGNAFENTLIETEQGADMNKMRISNLNLMEKKNALTNDSLYFGYKKITIPDLEHYYKVEDTVRFVSSHIKVYLEVGGISNTDASTTKAFASGMPKLVINNLAGSIDFENHQTKDLYSYYPKFLYNAEQEVYYTKISLMRFQKESSVTIGLEDSSGKPIYSMKMTDFLNKYAQFDLDKNEVTINISIDFTPQGVSVKAPDWNIDNGVKPEL